MIRYWCIFLFYSLAFTFQLNGQTPLIDSLKKKVAYATDQDKKLTALFAFCEQRQSLNTDTLCKYATEAKAISVYQNNPSNIALAEYNIATCLVKRGTFDSALKLCEINILKIINEKGAVDLWMKFTALKAQVLIKSNKYKEGIAEVYKILVKAEVNQDTLMQMVAKNAIGWANMEMNQASDALKWFFRALNTSANKSFHKRNSNIYSNIAAVYKQLHNYDKAEYYIKKAIVFSRSSQNLFFLANSLNILADIYIATKKAVMAEGLLTEALNIRKQIGDPYYIVSDISQLAIYYANISQPAKGIALSHQGIEMAKKFDLISKLPFLYHALGENYKASGDYLHFSTTLQKIMDLKDSMYVANSAEARAEMYTRYDLEKKEKLIAIQKLDISRKNSLIYGSLLLLFFTSVMAWMLFRAYKKNQQIKLLKLQTEAKKSAAHAVLSAEEKQRKRISRDLHDNIGAYATVLLANTEQLKKHASGQEIMQSAENVCHNAQNIMGSLQETIWVLNNDVITVTDFIDRLKLYSKKMLQHFPAIHIKFKEQIDKDHEMAPAEALHIFRIMQEALQNTIKHAQPRNIIISAQSDEMIIISIKDDGKGFNIHMATGGNGLSNMYYRAKEAGYNINILSGGSGTEIRLEKNHSFAVL